MPTCKKCNVSFPNQKFIDGKLKYLHKRSYCLDCSPIGKPLRFGPFSKDGINHKRGESRKNNCTVCKRDYITVARNLVCTTCRSLKQRLKKRNWGLSLLGDKCSRCSFDKKEILTFHHLNPQDKKFTISACWNRGKKFLEPEIRKCVLLCPNCHALEHYLERKEKFDTRFGNPN